MYQQSLINTVRSWERNLEITNQQHRTLKRFLQPVRKYYSSGEKPVAEREVTMYYTSLINAVQVWERRLEIEEERRNQRILKAKTDHTTIFRRLPRLVLRRGKKLIEKSEAMSCCHSRVDY